MNLDFKTLKYKHINDKWYALYEMTKSMWCIAVYANDEEEMLFSCIELDYVAALHKYNLIKDTNFIGE